jgi:hypothetical protein
VDPRKRIVTQIPVQRLWTNDGELPAARGRRLGREAIRVLLHDRPVRFVVANVGDPLRWIPVADRFVFWKSEATVHVTGAERIDLDSFPRGLAYVASEWTAPGDDVPIVLLEARH